ncbi:MAG: glucosamine-6-phosphate deaminase [Clostridiales bacterium]|nr:glucosamine-6-phosphate deaminase [Candidatus Apopatocola equi]
MKIIIDSEEAIAKKAAQRYVELLNTKPDAILGGATGSSPLGLYAELAKLCREGKISFKNARSFNLDEYVGLEGTHDQSYRYFMNHNLFEHIDIDIANTRVPDGINTAIAAEYDKEIEAAGGIDLQLLGIGVDGHIGFNEPGTPLDSVTHVVELTENTREVNSRFFASLDEVPTHAVTMGIKTVMNARGIILMAIGKSKAEICKAFIEGPITTDVPAPILQLHPNCEIYLDYEAASLLMK